MRFEGVAQIGIIVGQPRGQRVGGIFADQRVGPFAQGVERVRDALRIHRITQAAVAGEQLGERVRHGLAIRVVEPLAEGIECQADALRLQRLPGLVATLQVTCQTSHCVFAPAAIGVLGEGVQE
nr:hypothetical protein [Xanthomonas fragariae]